MTYFNALTTMDDRVWSAAHKRRDENVIRIAVTHSEGDFAYADVTIKNPRRPWLSPEMNVWMWLTKNDTPFFFGRLDATPEDLSGELVQMRFVARPADYEALKVALANSMKVHPFWDEIWVREDHIEDPDAAFVARSELIHVDRVNLAVTASDIINGEDGTITLDSHIYDSLAMSRGSAPVRRVRVEAEVSWYQTASGWVDITQQLKQAFALAGSTIDGVATGRMSSFTGQGLHEDHPEEGDNLRGGWSMGETSLLRVDGISVDQRHKDVTIQPTANYEGTNPQSASAAMHLSVAAATVAEPYSARFYLWEFVPKMRLNYEAERQRIEYLNVEVSADLQRVSRDDDELLVVPIQSKRIIEPIDPDGKMPIRNLHRRTFFATDRGKRAVENLIMIARAKLLSNSRAVEVSAAYTFDFGLQYSCRKNCVIVDPRLPNGRAAGKIIRYTLVADNNGSEYSTVTIGCAVGRGNSVAPTVGEAEYGEEDWDEDYQERVGGWVLPGVGDIIYEDYNDVEVGNSYEVDGVTYYDDADFDNLDVNPFIERFEVINGEAEQRSLLSGQFIDIPAAVEALNAIHTEVVLEMQPIDKVGPFITNYVVNTSQVQVPRMIDWETPA